MLLYITLPYNLHLPHVRFAPLASPRPTRTSCATVNSLKTRSPWTTCATINCLLFVDSLKFQLLVPLHCWDSSWGWNLDNWKLMIVLVFYIIYIFRNATDPLCCGMDLFGLGLILFISLLHYCTLLQYNVPLKYIF